MLLKLWLESVLILLLLKSLKEKKKWSTLLTTGMKILVILRRRRVFLFIVTAVLLAFSCYLKTTKQWITHCSRLQCYSWLFTPHRFEIRSDFMYIHICIALANVVCMQGVGSLQSSSFRVEFIVPYPSAPISTRLLIFYRELPWRWLVIDTFCRWEINPYP